MNLSISALTTWLSQYGTWGYVWAMAVPVVGYLIYSKLRGTPPPPVPAPASSATPPPALSGQYQLLGVLAQAMGWVPSGTTPTTAHIPAGMLTKLSQEVAGTTQAQVAGHVAALADLGSPVALAAPAISLGAVASPKAATPSP